MSDSTAESQTFLDWFVYGPDEKTLFKSSLHNASYFTLGALVGPIVWEGAIKPVIHKHTDPTGRKQLKAAQERVVNSTSNGRRAIAAPIRNTGDLS